jgi:spore coat polysaccharide biosynthesis protein SpsF
MTISGDTMLGRTVRRVQAARAVEEVAVATTREPADDAVADDARRLGVGCVRGSENDVLDRYVQAASALQADAVVRVTADCPLIDPEVIDATVVAFRSASPPVDYCSNVLDRTYPRGLDTEVVARVAVDRAGREAREPHQREHVTPYIYEHPEIFRLLSMKNADDLSHLRWTVDTPEDLAFVRAVYDALDGDEIFGWRAVLQLLSRRPSLCALNAHVRQRTLR